MLEFKSSTSTVDHAYDGLISEFPALKSCSWIVRRSSPFPPAFVCSVKVPPEGSKKQGPRRTERAVSSLLRTGSIFQDIDLRNCNFCYFTWRKPPLINAPKFNVTETCSFWISTRVSGGQI